jgi:hypothetical protein
MQKNSAAFTSFAQRQLLLPEQWQLKWQWQWLLPLPAQRQLPLKWSLPLNLKRLLT